jgi:hypothetical protein
VQKDNPLPFFKLPFANKIDQSRHAFARVNRVQKNERAPEGSLSETKRRHWPTSLRKMAGYMERPVELVPARLTAIKNKVAVLHPNMLGVNEKTFANHQANAKAALNWFAKEHKLPRRGTLMSARWQALHDGVENTTQRRVLSPFFRYLSHAGVEPEEVEDHHVDVRGKSVEVSVTVP